MPTSAELAVRRQKPLRVAHVIRLCQGYLFYSRRDKSKFTSGKCFQLCKAPLVAKGQNRGPILNSEKLRVNQIPMELGIKTKAQEK